jgi:hypothetical protein
MKCVLTEKLLWALFMLKACGPQTPNVTSCPEYNTCSRVSLALHLCSLSSQISSALQAAEVLFTIPFRGICLVSCTC